MAVLLPSVAPSLLIFFPGRYHEEMRKAERENEKKGMAQNTPLHGGRRKGEKEEEKLGKSTRLNNALGKKIQQLDLLGEKGI